MLVDVLCEGGEAPRWRVLGDRLGVHYIDALEEALYGLSKRDHRRRPPKLDVDGSEPLVPAGARRFITKSGLFGVEAKTSLVPSTQLPRSEFVELFERLTVDGCHLRELAFARAPTESRLGGYSRENWPLSQQPCSSSRLPLNVGAGRRVANAQPSYVLRNLSVGLNHCFCWKKIAGPRILETVLCRFVEGWVINL